MIKVKKNIKNWTPIDKKGIFVIVEYTRQSNHKIAQLSKFNIK